MYGLNGDVDPNNPVVQTHGNHSMASCDRLYIVCMSVKLYESFHPSRKSTAASILCVTSTVVTYTLVALHLQLWDHGTKDCR